MLWAGLAGALGPWLGRLSLMLSGRDIEARYTALIVLSSPVLTLGLSWLFLGGWPEPQELVGGGIMLLGIALPVASVLGRGRG